MSSAFGWSVALFAVVWMALAIRGIFHQYSRGERLNWLVWLAGLFVVLGALGFFGSALLSLRVVTLPPSFEWPPGYVNGVVTSPNGLNIVPLEPSGRIQVYGPQWWFVRGWQVDAKGGPFKVVASRPGTIEVYTLRGDHHFTYSGAGELLASTTYAEAFESLANGGRSMVVPTFPLLWPFSSPFLSVGLVVIGLLGLRLSKRLR
jgi:hypothetical protein